MKKLGQMWVVCTGASAKLLIAIYTYRDSRSKVTAEELLGSYDGIVQTDGLGSYGSGEYQVVNGDLERLLSFKARFIDKDV